MGRLIRAELGELREAVEGRVDAFARDGVPTRLLERDAGLWGGSSEVRERIAKHLDESPFELISLVVGNIDYPDVVARAVERKLAAQQVLEEKETQKAIARQDAAIRIEEAKGIAEAQRIINSTLTENYLQHEAISAQKAMAASPNHTTVYIPVGANGIPLVHDSRGP